ncbi:unnamed protein product [Echinostoma caproni]|uniref:Ras-related C3 botulinum toxin substrate 1 n=1 Tax=Echinostoma caproni TaxID=27848 RepID=A0A183AJ51_9TREM|nr:unnamed protein product [Echinostoma caproni]
MWGLQGDIHRLSEWAKEAALPINIAMSSNTINLVVIGDGAVGKTCLIESYINNPFPTMYVPTVFEKYTGSLTVNGQNLSLKIWDTAGQSDHEHIRGLTYSGVDAVILCYSVVHETSYENIRCKWSEELLKHLPGIPVVLVGTKIDLRERIIPGFTRAITYDQGSRLAKRIDATAYVECSALCQINIKEVFDKAIKAVLEKRSESKSPKKHESRKRSDKSRSRSKTGRKRSEVRTIM